MTKGDETVKVMVRCRPMNKKEIDNGSTSIVKIDASSNAVFLKDKQFTYDNVFGVDDSQESVYNCSAFSLVESVVQGYNGTIFAYGQTGCGKTHTMMGYAHNDVDKGIIPRTFDQVVSIIQNQDSDINFLVRCAFIEIYNEEIHDLLSKDPKAKYELKESTDKGVYVKDLNMMVVKTVKEMDDYMIRGNNNRSTGQTLMNKDSSRSHSIFTLFVEQQQKDQKENERITLGKLNLVDLAGSERLSKTGAQGDRLKEATKINMSLSALGNVISALVDGKSKHIPYRDSKLTRLLQDSLGGNTKTIMIANISPADYNYDETIGTLRYASRAKNITNKPKVNEDPKDALLKEYAEEIKRLKAQLESAGGEAITNSQNIVNSQGDLEVTSIQHSQVINNSGLMKQQNQLKQQNEEIENQLQKEKSEKQRLEAMMNQMKQNMFQGGGADDVQKDNYNKFKAKLEEQQKAHQEYVEQKQQEEEDMLLKEFVYQDLQEEVEHLRKVTKKLKKKYELESQEAKDLEYEHVLEKEDAAENLRIQKKEISLFKHILKHVFKKDEMEVLKGASKWSDLKNNYVVPPFLFRNKKLRFPKLSYQQGIDLIENEKENRELEIKPEGYVEEHSRKGKMGKFAATDEFGEFSLEGRQGQYSKQKNNKSQMDEFSQGRPHSIKKISENDEQECQPKQKVKLEPLKNGRDAGPISSPIPRNLRNQKLQPLQGKNNNKMEVNFKATIHINNNGDIYY